MCSSDLSDVTWPEKVFLLLSAGPDRTEPKRTGEESCFVWPGLAAGSGEAGELVAQRAEELRRCGS